MKKRQILTIAVVVAIGAILLSGSIIALAEDLKVGVKKGIGQKGIMAGLKGIEGIEAEAFDNFSVLNLSRYDVVVWPHGRLTSEDRLCPWRAMLTEYVRLGGGLILTHDAAGGGSSVPGRRRGDLAYSPLFPEIACKAGEKARKEKKLFKRVSGTDHPLAKVLPAEAIHAYYDHWSLLSGAKGVILMVDEDNDPVVVAGKAGNGRVVVMGNIPGYRATKKHDEATKLFKVTNKGEAPPEEGELELMVQSLRWAGEFFQKHLVLDLDTKLDSACLQAVAAAGVKKLPEAVFSSGFIGNCLDKAVWNYEVNPKSSSGKGYWYGGGTKTPWGNICSTTTPNKLLASQEFKRAPVQGRFVLSFDSMFTGYYAGLLDIRLLNAEGSGYGVELVTIGADDPLDTTKAHRTDHRLHRVPVKDAVNSIFRVDKGVKTTIGGAEGEQKRLRSIKKGLAGVPIRLERSEEGQIILSVDGMAVVRVRETTYDDFVKLAITMPGKESRVGFDNIKLTGYFAEEEKGFAATPWIIPEPKELKKTGTNFQLVDGAQFVVSDETKIDAYLLEEWIIPEIKGRYGVAMQAVTLDNVDSSKPAVYLGMSSNRAFKKIFNKKLKAIKLKSPGPEGYGIEINKNKAHLAGADERGTFWALMSMLQLVERKGKDVYLRGVWVRDYPDISLRGALTYPKKASLIENRVASGKRMVRMMARYKVSAWAVGNDRLDYPSYDVSGYGPWRFQEVQDLYRYATKHYIQIIPNVPSLSHCGWKISAYLSRTNPKLWQKMLDNQVLIAPLGRYQQNTLNPLSPLAWDMVKQTNLDVIKAFPQAEIIFAPTQDEISPPLNTLAPERTEGDLLVEWINRHHKLLKDQGKRMMMYCDYLLDVSKFKGSCASLGRTGHEGMQMHDGIDSIPRDIILIDWYYGLEPKRTSYKYLRDKGFDVVGMPGSNYGYVYESAYYAARELKKAGGLGIIRHGHPIGNYANPRHAYSLPWIYGWTVPEKMKPDWDWQEQWQDFYQGPLPSHTGTVEPVNIAEVCNESRRDEISADGQGWLDYGRIADLSKLPAGELRCQQWRFNIVNEAVNNGKSVIVLTSSKKAQEKTTRQAKGIKVNDKVKSLVFLSGTTSLGKVYALGLGVYRVRYEDGRTKTIPINYGHNIGPWIYSAGMGNAKINSFFKDGYLDFTRLAYRSRTALGEKAGLYLYEWINPYPEKKITSIDMELTKNINVRVALVALSVVK